MNQRIDIAENKSSEVSPKDIVSKHLTESVQNLVDNLRGGGCKRTRGVAKFTSEEEEEGQTGLCNKKGHHLIYFSHSSCQVQRSRQ